jgi:transcriptional regulator with XRE-family HTH domain
MSELGKTLSQARVARGLTLEDCERDTRISKRYLDALEREDWKVFPAPVYSRAFLRTYAQYLGLDPQQLMRMFQAQEEPPEVKPLPEIRPAPASGAINWPLAGAVAAFVIIAGGLLWLSSRGGDDGGNGGGTVTVETPQTEGEGGGLQPASGRPVGEIERGVVPDLTGVRIDDARIALDQAEINYVIIETDASRGTPGIVASQQPLGGTDAGGSTSVTLIVPVDGG